MDGTCKAGSTDIWIVTVASGIITEKNAAGESWDPLGGLPDPFACLTIGGQAQACTPAVQDTLTPAWNFQLGAATTAAIQAGIAVEIWDEDELSNDPICAALAIVPTDDGLAAGSMDVGCAQGTVTLLFTRSN